MSINRIRIEDLAPLQEEWRGEVEQISWSPRAYIFKGFLTDAECDHLISHVRTLWAFRLNPNTPNSVL